MGEWQDTTLGDLFDRGVATIQTGPFGSQLHASDYVTEGIRVVPTEAIGLRRLDVGVMPAVSQETAGRLARHSLQAGDILFARRGVQATGLSAIVEPQHDGFLCGTGALRLRLLQPSIVDPVFLSFLLISQESRRWLRAQAVGAVMPNLNEDVIRRFPVTLPPPDVQRAIARILGVLDDKIELNRRMNYTLETLARALFKSWFVDFDPVVAKAAGKQPIGMSPATATLFPDRFQDSELGPIPKGWRVTPIGDLVTVVGGATPSTGDAAYWNCGTVHWATPKDMAGLADPVLLHTERKITEEGLARISSGLLPRGTVLLSSRAPIGYLAIAEVPVAINQGFIAMRCDGNLSRYYAIHWTRENLDVIIGRANGTTFLEISKTNFRPIPVIVPPKALTGAFDQLVGTLFDRMVANLRQSRELASLRDVLLPRLMSGELRVRQAKKLVEAHL